MKRFLAVFLILTMLFSLVCFTACDNTTTAKPSDTHTHETEAPSETQDSSNNVEHTHTAADPVSENLVESTCTSKGSYDEVVYCTSCKYEFSRVKKEIDKKKHTFDKTVASEDYLKTAATCTEKAEYFYSCICGEKGSETFEHGDFAQHVPGTPTRENVVEATCGSEGSYTEVIKCKNCPYEISRTPKTIPLTGGHCYNQKNTDDKYKASDATCTEKAKYYYSCTCGEKGSETFDYGDTLDHTYDQEVATDKYKASDATCTEKAKYYYSCTCGEKGSETFDYGDTLDHTYDKKVATEKYRIKEETCSETGEYYFSCACGEKGSETFEVGTLPHEYNKQVATDEHKVSDATCTAKAKYYYSCECGINGSETFDYGDTLDHTYDQAVATDKYKASDATCIEKAKYYYSCTCGEKGSETFDYGDTLDHTYDQEVATDKYKASDATCTEKAKYYYSCTCGEKDTTRTFASGDFAQHTESDPVQENYSGPTYFRGGTYDSVVYCSHCGEELNSTPKTIPVKNSYMQSMTYMPEDTYDKVSTMFESNEHRKGTTPYYFENAPFALNDIESFKGTQLTSISIPVYKTGEAENGEYTFTISVFKRDRASINSSEAVRTYPIKISAQKYGFKDNTDVFKFITVDLTSYNLIIDEDELMAFGRYGDTLYPAYLNEDTANNTYPIINVLKQEFPRIIGFDAQVGISEWSPCNLSVLFNFTYKKAYENEDAYKAEVKADEDFEDMLATVSDAYAGKQLSVFGDSISTFVGISKDTTINSTIGNNLIWYSNKGIGGLYDHTYTYWGSMIRRAGMKLCVNNAWSGDSLGEGRYVTRVQNLHRNVNTTVNPDLILAYFGINDIGSGEGRNVGSLNTLLDNRGSKTEKQVIDEWIGAVIDKAFDDSGNYVKANLTNFDELYAVMLYLMTEKYGDAKIACITLVESVGYPNTVKWVPQYNQTIRALANYYGALVVEQGNVINTDNYMGYMHDNRVLHPNAAGHELIFEEVVRTLYADLAAQDGFVPTAAQDVEITLGGREEQDGSYVYTEEFIPTHTLNMIEGFYQGYALETSVYWEGGAPYAINDYIRLSGKKLTSITIPVHTTKDVDANGDYVFTMSVFKSDRASLTSSAPVKVYHIKISAAQYGLTPNTSNIFRFITLDLRDYNINIGEDEALAFGYNNGTEDVIGTLVPFYLNDLTRQDNAKYVWDILGKEAPQMLGFDMDVGASDWSPSYGNSLIYNFTYETVYEDKAAYDSAVSEFDNMREVVAEKYAGKKLSVFGDSISTMKGISNSANYNTTLPSNYPFYWTNNQVSWSNNAASSGPIYDSSFTYWGRLIDGLDMELCVSNAYGGDSLGSGRFITRAQNLHNDTGATDVNPDLVVVYYGINDTGSNRACYNLNTLVASRGNKTPDQAIKPFVDGVIEKYKNGELTAATANNYHFDELYALMLYLMTTKYQNAEFICVGLTDYRGLNADVITQYNKTIKALAEYFDILYVDQRSVINPSNYTAYMFDYDSIHPNAHGFEVIYETIVRAMYEDMTKTESDVYVSTRSYMPTETFNKIAKLVENESPLTEYSLGVTPFAYIDSESFEGHKITSITMPVMRVKDIANGNYVFTLRKLSARTANATVIEEYKLLISAAKHGLPTENTSSLYEMITVDLTDYNIVIGEGEVLGFGDDYDTLYPGYVTGGEIMTTLNREFPVSVGFSGEIGHVGEFVTHSNIALLFDFTLERTVKREQLVSDTVYNAVKASFDSNGGSAYVPDVAPFGFKNRTLMSNSLLTSITIPVHHTNETTDGYYTLTIQTFVPDETATATAGFRKTAEYKIKVYSSNPIGKGMITVDIRDYGIYLDDNEFPVFCMYGDSLIPTWFNNDATRAIIANDCSDLLGFYGQYGQSSLMSNGQAIFYNFTYESDYVAN